MTVAGRVALTKKLRDGRTAVITVAPAPGLYQAATTVRIDGKQVGVHLGPHHAAPPAALAAAPGAVAAIGPVLLTADEAAQIESVYRDVSASIPPDLAGEREGLVLALDAAGQEPIIRAAERLDAGYPDPFAGDEECERRIGEAREALAAFDAAHPEIAAQAAARREDAIRRALEGRD